MTRPQGFDVRVAPRVLATVGGGRPGVPQSKAARGFADAMDRLGREGTRAFGVKKIKGLDLWELRLHEQRVFFRLVKQSNLIAVGAIVTKKARRMRMAKLKQVERVVAEWSDELESPG